PTAEHRRQRRLPEAAAQRQAVGAQTIHREVWPGSARDSELEVGRDQRVGIDIRGVGRTVAMRARTQDGIAAMRTDDVPVHVDNHDYTATAEATHLQSNLAIRAALAGRTILSSLARRAYGGWLSPSSTGR